MFMFEDIQHCIVMFSDVESWGGQTTQQQPTLLDERLDYM